MTFAAAVAEREIGPRGRRVRSERQAGPRGARMLYSYLPRRPDANDSCPRASIQPLCVLHSSQLRTFCFFVLSRRGIAEYGDLVRRFHFDRTRKLSSIYEGDGRSMGASFLRWNEAFELPESVTDGLYRWELGLISRCVGHWVRGFVEHRFRSLAREAVEQSHLPCSTYRRRPGSCVRHVQIRKIF